MAQPLKRISTPARVVLQLLTSDPLAEWYGLDLARQSGLKSGSIYPILARLEEAGWLTGRWEDADPSTEGRPRRRYYKLSDSGIDLARAAVADAPPEIWRWLPGGAQ